MDGWMDDLAMRKTTVSRPVLGYMANNKWQRTIPQHQEANTHNHTTISPNKDKKGKGREGKGKERKGEEMIVEPLSKVPMYLPYLTFLTLVR
ncbi:hypothetical protein EYC84_000605 [Monilinia fructicola]|uniref:Uncharacterized protein n=1 Tax=Monilinia fructicola TaxID=38448 RepID=A0A5M9JT89_MONFR|nr:hypothetical protein EYC84_000605 [Monilinia fructicola]